MLLPEKGVPAISVTPLEALAIRRGPFYEAHSLRWVVIRLCRPSERSTYGIFGRGKTGLSQAGTTGRLIRDGHGHARRRADVSCCLDPMTIAGIRHRYMGTPPLRAALQVILGGALVFLTGVLIGSS